MDIHVDQFYRLQDVCHSFLQVNKGFCVVVYEECLNQIPFIGLPCFLCHIVWRMGNGYSTLLSYAVFGSRKLEEENLILWKIRKKIKSKKLLWNLVINWCTNLYTDQVKSDYSYLHCNHPPSCFLKYDQWPTKTENSFPPNDGKKDQKI